MIIIIFEYTSNMVVHIHSKYTFMNILHPIIFFRIHKRHLYIFIGLQLNWSHLQLMEHTLFFLGEN
jgi:hypothetical protein